MATHAQGTSVPVTPVLPFRLSEQFRVLAQHDEIWLAARDIVFALGYSESATIPALIAALSPSWQGVATFDLVPAAEPGAANVLNLSLIDGADLGESA